MCSRLLEIFFIPSKNQIRIKTNIIVKTYGWGSCSGKKYLTHSNIINAKERKKIKKYLKILSNK